MIAGLGLAASALDALQALINSRKANGATSTAQKASGSAAGTTSFDVSNAGSGPGKTTGTTAASQSGALAPSTLAALFDAQGNATSSASAVSRKPDALKSLFAQLDTDGNGQISRAEFEDKLGAGGTNVAAADSVFAKLDANADGAVSQDELGAALKGAHGKGHHHHHSAQSPTGAGGDSDPLLQALQGASSITSSNSDGTTTTSMTYADGSQVAMTSAPKNAAASAATSSYNFIEQMIQRQAKALQSSASTGLSINA